MSISGVGNSQHIMLAQPPRASVPSKAAEEAAESPQQEAAESNGRVDVRA